MNMKFGISSYTYTWGIGLEGKEPENPLTPYDLIDKASALKVSCVQIADNMPLHSYQQEDLAYDGV